MNSNESIFAAPLRRGLRGLTAALAFAGAATLAPSAAADGTDLLQDFERERAALVATLLDGELSATDRLRYRQSALPRLADLERLVLRDDSLVGSTDRTVKRAFEDYELTFLVHAAAERGRSPLDQWLAEVGLDTDAMLTARPGRAL